MKSSGRGLPKMQIRNAQSIIDELGQQAILNGFINHAIHTFIEHPIWEDDLAMESCKYSAEVNDGLWKNDTTYESVMYLRDDLKSQYQKEFDLNQTQVDDMTYHDAYQYADAVYSERFEGLITNTEWTPDQIGMVNTTQLYALTLPFPDYDRKLWISKVYEKPIREIQSLTPVIKAKPQYCL